MRRRAKHSWLIVFALLPFINGFSQANYQSPYSHYGIGDLSQINHPVQQSMGGLSIAMRDKALINYRNPASYTAFDSLSFVFDGGIQQKLSTWESLSNSEQSEYSTISHLTMGFPVTKWLRVTAGLIPMSTVGYEISDLTEITDIGSVEHLYEGDGGVNEFFIGGGFKLSERLSVGANASYVWGDVDLSQLTNFPDSIYYWSAKVSRNRHISDIKFSYGLQYVQPLNNDWQLITGLTYANKTDLSATEEYISTQMIRSDSGTEATSDTITYDPKNKGSVTLPPSYGIGFMLEKRDRFKIGLDYRLEQWSEYEAFGEPGNLENSSYIGLGTEIWPKHNVLSSYLKKIKYRFGVHYTDSYLELDEEQISEVGIAFGLGLPINNSSSSINFAAEYGQRGTTDNGLLKENYFKFTLGISFYERWFIKRKYQ